MSDVFNRITDLSSQKRELLARLLKQRGLDAARLPIGPRSATGPAELSFAQQRLWFLNQLDPANSFYNVPAVVQLGGALDAEALERALNAVVQRHEALRTVFPLEHGRPVQQVLPALALPLARAELPGADAAAIERAAAAIIQPPFDLAGGPLLRAALLRLGEQAHVLVLVLHHIVADGWSINILIRELTAGYQALVQGRPLTLPSLPIQYADYAAWQRQVLEGALLDAQLAYWRAQLAGAPTLDLPTDFARPPIQTFRGARQLFVLPATLRAALLALAQAEHATLFMVLLAAFQLLLARWSDQDDIVVGTPIAGRDRAEVHDLIGCFVNTLVLRTNMAGNPSFRTLLARVRDTTLGAFAHQDLPFEQLVEALQPTRDLSRQPLFQAMFILQDDPLAGVPPAGLQLQPLVIEQGSAQFDLSLSIMDSADRLVGQLEYATDLFAPATIARMAGHFTTLLAALAADPAHPIAALPLLTPAEHAQLHAFNATATAFPPAAPLHVLIAAQATATPTATALIADGPTGTHSLTFAALDARANQLAHTLRAAGVGPDTRVGICFPRSCDLLVGLLAILKAGAAYLPLDPAYPPARLAFMLADAQLTLLLTHSALAARLPAHPTPTHLLDAPDPTTAAQPTTPPRVPLDPDHAAYVIYTSGSTGQPKGAIITHRAILNRLRGMQATYALTPADRVLQKTPLSFDVAVWECFWPLLTGATLVLARPDGHTDPAYLAELIATQRITTLHFVPSMLAAFLDAPALPALPSLRRLICSGEALPAALAARAHARLPGVALHNLYGPTEAAVDVTAWACVVGDPQPSVPIGRPVANTQIHLLDRHMQPVAVGVPGELYIGGAQLARGYLHRPALTAARFVPDPYSAAPGARLYRSGDRARYRPDGSIEYLGRLDQQVKLRGMRIELGEIEARLLQHPAIATATVALRDDSGDPQLVAYLAPAAGVPDDELRTFLKHDLPDYMLPAAFVWLDALPLLPNGKLDRRVLPAPARPRAAGAYVAPRTPLEELLAGIWATVLGLERVGIHDNFFELGGHSLRATQVVARVRTLLPVALALRQLFETPTVAGLATALASATPHDDADALPPIQPADRTAALPLSFAQQRLWFLAQLQPESAFYTIALALQLHGPLDHSALAAGLHALVQRHESLRTTFAVVDGQPRQLIAPAAPPALPLIDLRDQPAAARLAAAQQLAAAALGRPFDLAHGPLLRCQLFQLDDTTHLFVIALHHTIADGWSLGVLVRDLAALYAARGAAEALPPLALQYADYAMAQRAWLQGPARARQLAYWRAQLAGAPTLLELPTDRPRPPVQTFHGAALNLLVPAPVAAALHALARHEGATLFMVLLAAFQVLLARWSGQAELLVGSPIAGRSQPALEELIGCFVNTLVLRANLADNPSFRALLARVRETTLGAYAHQDLPFEYLVEALQPARDLRYTPLVQVLFALQNTPLPSHSLPGLTITPAALPSGSATNDLTLTLGETAGGLAGTFEFNTDLFDTATIAALAEHYITLLAAIVAQPDQPVALLPLLSAAARAEQLVRWNATHAPLPGAPTLPAWFAQQAARTPDAPAVLADRPGVPGAPLQLSYAALDARANQLAHYLRGLGVGPEARVAICLERSAELLVALLGVLKAGGAYLPLDPAYPHERLAYMLADAQAAVLLTDTALAAGLPATDAQVVRLDTAAALLAQQPATALPDPPDPDALAYLIYTSGSTGAPKGVQIAHRALVNFLAAMALQPGLQANDTVLSVTTLSFDIAGLELFLPLVVGARLVLAPRTAAADGFELAARISSSAATMLQATPSTWRLLLDAGWPGSPHLVLLCGGEALPAELAARLAGRGAALWNMYGPTETTIWSTLARVTDGAAPVPIGRPIANTQVYVLDPSMQPVPVGAPGELYIGGLGLARGYRNRPDLTAERFVPDPFGTTPGARLYRTGDRVCYRRDGTLVFLGRLDSQVKLHGYRIELGEIEATLKRHPAVRAAVALIRQDTPGDQRLVAYVVPSSPAGADMAALRDYLRGKLPAAMIPAAFVALETLPTTPNGKLDRRALPAPARHRTTEPADHAPRSSLERTIAAAWQAVLAADSIGIDDNFFDIGGDSLRMAQLHSRLRELLGRELTLLELFEYPSIRALTEHLSRTAPDQPDQPDQAAEQRRAGKQRLNRQLQQRRAAQPDAAPEDEHE